MGVCVCINLDKVKEFSRWQIQIVQIHIDSLRSEKAEVEMMALLVLSLTRHQRVSVKVACNDFIYLPPALASSGCHNKML